MSILFEQYLALKKERPQETTVSTQATQPISPETLERVFQECLDDLNRRTLEGLLGEASPSMLAQEQEAKDRLDKTWKECLEGRVTLEISKEAVSQWHKAVIKLFSRRPKAGQGRVFR